MAKLIRDRSTREKDQWWSEVSRAAASAPTLTYEKRSTPMVNSDGGGGMTRLFLALVVVVVLTGCKYDAEIVSISDGRLCIIKLPYSDWIQESVECAGERTDGD